MSLEQSLAHLGKAMAKEPVRKSKRPKKKAGSIRYELWFDDSKEPNHGRPAKTTRERIGYSNSRADVEAERKRRIKAEHASPSVYKIIKRS